MCKVMVGGFGSVTERFRPGRAVLIITDGSKMLFSSEKPQQLLQMPPLVSIPASHLISRPDSLWQKWTSISSSSDAQILMLSECALLGTSGRLSGGDPEEVNPAAKVIHK